MGNSNWTWCFVFLVLGRAQGGEAGPLEVGTWIRSYGACLLACSALRSLTAQKTEQDVFGAEGWYLLLTLASVDSKQQQLIYRMWVSYLLFLELSKGIFII